MTVGSKLQQTIAVQIVNRLNARWHEVQQVEPQYKQL